VPGRDSNPRPLDRKSDTLLQHHDSSFVVQRSLVDVSLPTVTTRQSWCASVLSCFNV